MISKTGGGGGGGQLSQQNASLLKDRKSELLAAEDF